MKNDKKVFNRTVQKREREREEKRIESERKDKNKRERRELISVGSVAKAQAALSGWMDAGRTTDRQTWVLRH